MTERFQAPLARVFDAWTNARQLQLWFAPGDMRVPEAAADVRPGGRYRIVMERADGEQRVVTGEYRDVVPNQRLAFTWQWEGSKDITLVELAFKALDPDNTELRLVHSQFTAAQDRDMHGQGWAGCIAKLRTQLST